MSTLWKLSVFKNNIFSSSKEQEQFLKIPFMLLAFLCPHDKWVRLGQRDPYSCVTHMQIRPSTYNYPIICATMNASSFSRTLQITLKFKVVLPKTCSNFPFPAKTWNQQYIWDRLFGGKIQEQSFFHFNLQWKSSLRHDACMYTKNYISISTLKDVPKKSLQHFKPVFCDHHFAFKILWIKGDGTKYAHIPWRQVIHPSHHSV